MNGLHDAAGYSKNGPLHAGGSEPSIAAHLTGCMPPWSQSGTEGKAWRAAGETLPLSPCWNAKDWALKSVQDGSSIGRKIIAALSRRSGE